MLLRSRKSHRADYRDERPQARERVLCALQGGGGGGAGRLRIHRHGIEARLLQSLWDCCGKSCEEEEEEESSKRQDAEEEQQGGGALMKLFIEVELGPDEISLATELFRTMRYV